MPGDLGGALSGIGDTIGSLFSSAPAAATDVSSAASAAPIDLGAGVPGIGAGALGAASPIGTTFDPSTVFGGISDVGGAIDPTIAADITTPLSDIANAANIGASTANIPFTAGPTTGQTQLSSFITSPAATSTGAGTPLPMDTVPPIPPATVPAAATATEATPVAAAGAGGGGGLTAGANAPAGGSDLDAFGGSTMNPENTSGPVTDPNAPGSEGFLGRSWDWLTNQLGGSASKDLALAAALGSLGLAAFKKPAIPGAGQALSAGPTSTGEAVSNAQGQQQTAAQEAATQAQQEQLATQNQAIAGTQTAAATPLMQTGQNQVAAAASGQLTAAQQAYVASALQSNQEQIRAKYANLGLSGSTMEVSDLNQATLQSQALVAQLLNQNQTQGLSTVTGAEALLSGADTSLAGASGDINTGVNALNSSVSALGDASNTYLAILQQQLAQDQQLQDALASMSKNLGTSTALLNVGNAANTAGATSA